jgi:HSP20 family molecular chaperone IbpA
VKISHGQLVIEGVRCSAADDSGDGYRSGTGGDPFKRTIMLPDDVDTRRAFARLSEGVLEISIPLTTPAAASRRLALD